MLFDNILGQDSAIATLRQALAHNRLGHAYLFTGPIGVGKKRTALTLSQALLCSEKPGEGCDVCPSCISVIAGTHPDLHLVAPLTGKRDIITDQIRELQHVLGLRPVRGGKRLLC